MIKRMILAPKISPCQCREDCGAFQFLGTGSRGLSICTGHNHQWCYKLPFITCPQPMIAKNHHSAVKHAKFVEESIGDLVHSRCARESMSCPIVCSPLLVVENAKGKLRLVIDLRYVNQFVIQCNFINMRALISFPPNLGKVILFFPLTSSLATTMWTFMRIHSLTLVFPGVRVMENFFIFFCVLPLGLSTARYVFTKFLRPLVKRWRSMGLPWGAKCVKNTYKCCICISPSDI